MRPMRLPPRWRHTTALFAAWELFSAELRAVLGANHEENSGSAHAARAAFDTRCNRSKQGDPSMETINVPYDVNHDPRHFFATAAFAIPPAQLALPGPPHTPSTPPPQPATTHPQPLPH